MTAHARLARLEARQAPAVRPYRPREDIVQLFMARGLDRDTAERMQAAADAKFWVRAWLANMLVQVLAPLAPVRPELLPTDAIAAAADFARRAVRPPDDAIRAQVAAQLATEADAIERAFLPLLRDDLDQPGRAERFAVRWQACVRAALAQLAQDADGEAPEKVG